MSGLVSFVEGMPRPSCICIWKARWNALDEYAANAV